MSKVVQAAEFFVVGGPVQADRLCYIERAADRALEAAIAARGCCFVLGARGIGKTSLVGRVARTLRQSGELAAIVDLGQIAARGDDADADRWTYGIVYRIAHELRLRLDLSAWWQERTAVARETRLADFFWEVVLTNTTSPVTVLVDDVELAFALPFGNELLAAIDECYARRARESDYSRLTFVLAGVAAREQLQIPDGSAELASAQSIDLADFTPEEAYGLSIGFGGEREQAQALMDRVCAWTGGHPYFTQRVARGVARKGGKLEDVERVVHEQLLIPSAMHEEPLASMRGMLTERRPAARRALKQMRRIAKGAPVALPSDAAVRDVLLLSGVVATDSAGQLRYRNRIARELFGRRWVKSVAPLGWRAWAAAAAVVVAVALGAFAYLNYLPQTYVRVLTSPAADAAAVDAAYRSLRRLPGFAARADELLAGALRRRGADATDVAALASADTQLRALPGQGEAADRLLADFWLRKTTAAAAAEQRDAALLFALRAAASPSAGSDAARAWVGVLAGDDYRLLERTLDLATPPDRWGVDWASSSLLAIGPEPVVRSVPLAAGNALGPAPLRLSALQHTALERELRVEGEGSAGEFELAVTIAHPASAELSLTLAAPNGARATVVVPQSTGAGGETYVLAAQEGTPLAALADEERRGTWRLTLIDRRVENAGTLAGWGMRFGDESWRDDPPEPVAIPDAQRTESVTFEVSADEAFAIAQPATSQAVGSVALWNVATGRLQADFTLPAAPRHVAINATGTRLLAATANLVTMWNVADGMPVARLATQTEFVLPPAFSTDGGYVAIAERVEDALPLYSLLRADDGSLLASIEGGADIERWWLGPGARYLALLSRGGPVRIVDARRGTELRRLANANAVVAVLPLPDGVTLLTVDDAGEIRAWTLDPNASGGAAGRMLGVTTAADGVSVSSDGLRLAYPAGVGEFVVRDVASGARLRSLRMDGAAGPARARLAPDGARLVTASGTRFRLWALPTAAEEALTAERAADLDVAALGVDGSVDTAVVGFRDGQLRITDAANASRAALLGSSVDYFGHRGAPSAIAVNGPRGIAASGGTDGVVRVWDLASGAPAGPVLAHAIGRDEGPITALALSSDGRLVASAAPASVRVWSIADGSIVLDIPLRSPTDALAFAPDATAVALGQRDGALRIAPLDGGVARTTIARGTIASVAFAPSGNYVATASGAGVLQIWRRNGDALGAAELPSAARWVSFGGEGVVLAATDRWLHSYSVGEGGPTPLHALPLAFSAVASRAFAAGVGERARVAGFDGRGMLGLADLELGGLPAAGASSPELLERDWTPALGLKLDEAGNPAPVQR